MSAYDAFVAHRPSLLIGLWDRLGDVAGRVRARLQPLDLRIGDVDEATRDAGLLLSLMAVAAGLLLIGTLATTNPGAEHVTRLEQQHAQWEVEQAELAEQGGAAPATAHATVVGTATQAR